MATRRERPKIYTAQVVIMEEPHVAGRLRAWADVRDTSVAALARECLRAGLEKLEPGWVDAAEGRELAADFLAKHVADAVK